MIHLSEHEKYDFDEAVEALQRVFGIVGISPVVIYEDQGFDQMLFPIWKQDILDTMVLSRFTHEEPRNLIRSHRWK